MKKFLFTAAAILCAVLLSVNLSSCSEKNDEPDVLAFYYYGGSTDNDYKHFRYAEGDELCQKTYDELIKELKSILVGDDWKVTFKKDEQDAVLKREDEAAKKKYAEMETKLMAFKDKIDKLDKTQDKYKFDFSIDVNIRCVREINSVASTLESRTIRIKYVGIVD